MSLNSVFVFILQGIPKCTGFLEGVLCWLPNAIHQSADFPVLEWEAFLNAVRSNVNPLAGEEHIKDICSQLQTMGEVISLITWTFYSLLFIFICFHNMILDSHPSLATSRCDCLITFMALRRHHWEIIVNRIHHLSPNYWMLYSG